MSIQELYRSIKNQARQFARRDGLYVLWAYSQYLQLRNFRIPGDIEVLNRFLNADLPMAMLAPWTVEQIAREIVLHSDEEARRGQSLRKWSSLAQIANLLRDMEGQIYSQLVGGGKIHLELMRIAHRQFVWQQHRFNWRLIIRYYKLFNIPAINAHAIDAIELTIDQIFLIGMAYLGIFLEHPRSMRQLNVEIPGIQQQDIDRFLKVVSLRRAELARRLRSEHSLDETFAYRYSSLREFPLIVISYLGHDEVACPVPTLLLWRITTGLYYALKDQRGFPSAFGASFQSYVGEVLGQRMVADSMTVLAETEYHVRNHRKDTVDWIIQEGDVAAMFVECKTKRLTWASKIGLTDLSALEQDIRKLAGAVVQVYRTIVDYRAGRYPNLAYVEGRQIYPVIVTLEDWYFFGAELPGRLEAAVRVAMEAGELPVGWIEEMPYSILSVHEFEKVSGVMNAVGVHTFVSTKMSNPDTRRWAYGTYCNDRYPAVVRGLPALFRDEFDSMFPGLRN
jgi:hypothetical protein